MYKSVQFDALLKPGTFSVPCGYGLALQEPNVLHIKD